MGSEFTQRAVMHSCFDLILDTIVCLWLLGVIPRTLLHNLWHSSWNMFNLLSSTMIYCETLSSSLTRFLFHWLTQYNFNSFTLFLLNFLSQSYRENTNKFMCNCVIDKFIVPTNVLRSISHALSLSDLGLKWIWSDVHQFKPPSLFCH